MKNNMSALNNYLFEQIEKINDDSIKGEELEAQLKKTDAIVKVAKALIDNASVALSAQKHLTEYGSDDKVQIPLLGIGEDNERSKINKIR